MLPARLVTASSIRRGGSSPLNCANGPTTVGPHDRWYQSLVGLRVASAAIRPFRRGSSNSLFSCLKGRKPQRWYSGSALG